MDALPTEIKDVIICFLPAGYLPFIRAVSREWLRIPVQVDPVFDLVRDRSPLVYWYPPSGEWAVKLGWIEYLKWVHETSDLDPNITTTASKFGQIAVLEWAVANGFKLTSECAECALNLETYKHISKTIPPMSWHYYNNIEIMEYLHELGIPIHEQVGIGRNLEDLKWLFAHGMFLTPSVIKGAMETGNLETIQWMYQHVNVAPFVNYAADRGHIDVLKWIDSIGLLDHNMCVSATFSGSIVMMDWVRTKFPWTTSTAKWAACSGLELLKHLIDNGCPWDHELLNCTTHIDVIKYGMELGAMPNAYTMLVAINNGDVEIVKFLLALGIKAPYTITQNQEIQRLVRGTRLMFSDDNGSIL